MFALWEAPVTDSIESLPLLQMQLPLPTTLTSECTATAPAPVLASARDAKNADLPQALFVFYRPIIDVGNAIMNTGHPFPARVFYPFTQFFTLRPAGFVHWNCNMFLCRIEFEAIRRFSYLLSWPDLFWSTTEIESDWPSILKNTIYLELLYRVATNSLTQEMHDCTTRSAHFPFHVLDL